MFEEDSKRNGLFSTIVKKLNDLEKFMRDHQSVSHALQTYVDNTAFTPTIAGTATTGVGTYTTQLGEYSRIGNIVFFEIALVWSAHTGTGNMTVKGLPIVSSSNGMNSPCSVFWSNITLTAVGNKLLAIVNNASQIITLHEIGSATQVALPIDTAANLQLSGFYFVD